MLFCRLYQESSANVLTFYVNAEMVNFALIMENVCVINVTVNQVGEVMLANVRFQLIHAKTIVRLSILLPILNER